MRPSPLLSAMPGSFGLDPIKSKVVIASLLYECEMCSAFPLIAGKPPPWIRLTNHDLLAIKSFVFSAP